MPYQNALNTPYPTPIPLPQQSSLLSIVHNNCQDLKQAGAQLNMVSIQFPDPHFKNKHKKRRVVNASLVDTIVSNLEVGKLVFVQVNNSGDVY